MYHLSDQEIYKAKILQPAQPEILWLHHFGNNFGQMYALRNYTEQVKLLLIIFTLLPDITNLF